MEDIDKASKIKGLAWVIAAVGIAAVFGFGITPFVRAIPWSWEKKISHVVGSVTSNVCSGNPKNEALLNQLVTRLYPLDREDAKVSINVQMVNDPTVNAFAGLGGNIVVNSGLLEQAESAEEVAGVLAHEIEHVRHRHILEGFVVYLMTAEGVRILFSGGSVSNAKWASYFLHMGFSRSQEAEADEGALLRLQKAHVDNKGFREFFARMKKMSLVPSFLSDHPSNQSRSEMAEKFPSQDVKPIMTDEEWKTFKEYCQ